MQNRRNYNPPYPAVSIADMTKGIKLINDTLYHLKCHPATDDVQANAQHFQDLIELRDSIVYFLKQYMHDPKEEMPRARN